ncbi:hypothetical protein P3T76_004397 [Phytophthora citrophthora]|uniref:Uncharacterized protein n=1 Tax=Phytophthora citrophthora TaxID=4793 RepID=A0AAD9GTC9_9STRA|nr:hypothetical protein P3T76_004397 [Phytophthora citrophthora]
MSIPDRPKALFPTNFIISAIIALDLSASPSLAGMSAMEQGKVKYTDVKGTAELQTVHQALLINRFTAIIYILQ